MSTTTTTWPLTPDGRLLVLRTCDENMKAHGGFQWPTEGHVEAPDWDPDPSLDCGGGLHGLPWGCGNVSLLNTATGAHWLVVAVDPADVANLDQPGKVRFRAAEVLLVTVDRDDALAYLAANGATGLPVVYGTATAGHRGTATAGHRGTATAGHDGTATAGNAGTATAGHDGTATAGDSGTATAGYGGTATAGENGRLVVSWWDDKARRYRITVGYVGEDGIKANTAYRCDSTGKLIEAVSA